MNPVIPMLISAIAAGTLAVVIGIGMDLGLGWLFVSYYIGGMVGMLMTGLLFARMRDRVDADFDLSATTPEN